MQSIQQSFFRLFLAASQNVYKSFIELLCNALGKVIKYLTVVVKLRKDREFPRVSAGGGRKGPGMAPREFSDEQEYRHLWE
jgi:hypothetical protein